jgi:S-adenosylmethionine hydrolase
VERLVRLSVIQPTIRDGVLESVIVHVLIFGNVTLAGVPADLEAAIGPLTPGRPLVMEFPASGGAPAIEERTVWEQTFGRVPVGASLLIADSEGNLELADNQGDVAGRLGLALERPVRIRSA